MINNIINWLTNSNNDKLNDIGNSLNIYNRMKMSREALITESYDNGSKDEINNLLMEMLHLINNGYYGNKEYLFERMDYLITQGLKHQASKMISSGLKVNNMSFEALQKKALPKRDKYGRFVASRRK